MEKIEQGAYGERVEKHFRYKLLYVLVVVWTFVFPSAYFSSRLVFLRICMPLLWYIEYLPRIPVLS